MPTTPHEVIAGYAPTVIPAKRWDAVRDFVTESVSTAATEDWSADKTRAALRTVARLADYVSMTGREVSVETVFTEATVNAYVDQSGYSTHVQGTTRSLLRVVGQAAHRHYDTPRQRPQYGTDKKSAPYTPDEVTRLRHWADGEATVQRRQQANLLLALTLGAGLRSGEVAALTAADAETDETGTVVYPSGYRGAGRRFVPVDHDWAQPIRDAVERAKSPDSWLFRPERTTSSAGTVALFLKRSHRPSLAVDMSRARTTWIVTQVRRGVPESAVIEAAGLSDLQHYRKFLVNEDQTTAREARSLLHGGPKREAGRTSLTVIRGGA
ncbi:tyrosine-type recombinase/integrase [Corynebacterium tuscaniense]|uniref:tyrosine-type recombinase/integrase n=1 Tax=Corynebacterium tuscaniense TaxID=302449 RepID=UPI00050D9AFA|nr:tyrosine-type recombinase/integrase [Corynebacterium tuscaniense]KGF24113.1 integrase [Corynebacterium tuscaniense DNF00037]